jgi:hypothetical protein
MGFNLGLVFIGYNLVGEIPMSPTGSFLRILSASVVASSMAGANYAQPQAAPPAPQPAGEVFEGFLDPVQDLRFDPKGKGRVLPVRAADWKNLGVKDDTLAGLPLDSASWLSLDHPIFHAVAAPDADLAKQAAKKAVADNKNMAVFSPTGPFQQWMVIADGKYYAVTRTALIPNADGKGYTMAAFADAPYEKDVLPVAHSATLAVDAAVSLANPVLAVAEAEQKKPLPFAPLVADPATIRTVKLSNGLNMVTGQVYPAPDDATAKNLLLHAARELTSYGDMRIANVPKFERGKIVPDPATAANIASKLKKLGYVKVGDAYINRTLLPTGQGPIIEIQAQQGRERN